MAEITARVCIDGREVDYIDGSYKNAGNLTAAELNFKLPLTYGGMKKLWNKEVTFYLNEFDTVPMFRGWIRRTNETFNDIEIADPEFYELFRGRHQECLEEEITDFKCVVRKAITDEVKRSALNTKYGMVHRDTWSFGSILHFVQSYDGGTAFFEDVVDRTPDIEVSAYPNRLVMYNGRRWHSSCTDFTFDERYVLVSFFECSNK